MKYLKSFLLQGTSGEGSKIPAEVFARRIEWQGKYGRLSTLNVDTLAPRLQVPSSLPPVHLQLLASPWQTLPTGKSPDHAATSIHRINSLSLHSEVCVLVEAAETAQKQHQPLSVALGGLHGWQSNERLSRLPNTATRFASKAAAADEHGYMHSSQGTAGYKWPLSYPSALHAPY